MASVLNNYLSNLWLADEFNTSNFLSISIAILIPKIVWPWNNEKSIKISISDLIYCTLYFQKCCSHMPCECLQVFVATVRLQLNPMKFCCPLITYFSCSFVEGIENGTKKMSISDYHPQPSTNGCLWRIIGAKTLQKRNLKIILSLSRLISQEMAIKTCIW